MIDCTLSQSMNFSVAIYYKLNFTIIKKTAKALKMNYFITFKFVILPKLQQKKYIESLGTPLGHVWRLKNLWKQL